MNKELLKSVFRSIVQVIGVLLVVGIKIPLVSSISEALNFLLSNIDQAWQAGEIIWGVVVTLIGFFSDKSRFEAREIGAKVVAMAKKKGVSAQSIIDKAA